MVTTLNASATGQPAVEQEPRVGERVEERVGERAGDHSEVFASPLAETSSTTSMTRDEFSIVFDRCFDRVYSYVARRIEDQAICERVADDVLTSNLYLLVDRVEYGRLVRALKVSCDVRIDEQKVSGPSTHIGRVAGAR